MAPVFALAIAASSCSGGDGVSEPIEPTSVPATTITPTTTEPAVDETTTAAVETTTTTVAPEQATTTESAPSTTDDVPPNTVYDPATVEGEIEQAVLSSGAAYERCISDFVNCDIDEATAYSTGAYAKGFRDALFEWRSAGYEITGAESYSYRVEQVTFTPAEKVAVATWCVNDLTVVTQPETASEDEMIVDSASPSYRVSLQVDQVDGSWYVSASNVLERSSTVEDDLCA